MKQVLFLTSFIFCFSFAFCQSDENEKEDKHPQAPKAPQFIIKPIGENVQLGIGGFVNMIGVFDLKDGLKDPLDFITYDIPVNSKMKYSNEFRFNANESRLFTELVNRTKYGLLKIYAEADFANDGNLRLRQAYGTFKGFTIGKTWSTFMDLGALPNTIDFEGPGGASASRSILIRYSKKFGNSFSASIGCESPEASITNPFGSDNTKEYVPDFIGRFRVKNPWGHLQFAGVFRDISFQDTLQNKYRAKQGWGVSFSGNIGFTKSIALSWQGIYGDGIAGYLVDISGAGLDLVPTEGSADLMALEAYGFFTAVSIKWTAELSSNFIYSLCKIKEIEHLPDNEYKSGQYTAVNLFWDVLPALKIGMEYLWGERKNKNDEKGNAQRVNLLTKFYF